MKRNIYLSVIMPAYNEGENIYNNLLLVADILNSIVERYEIICVDDGSVDETVKQVKLAKKNNTNISIIEISPNQGKGNALRAGTKISKGNYVLFLDSDLDLSPATIIDFLNILDNEKADVVIGSKLHPNSIITYPLIRRIISFGYYLVIRLLFHLNIRDTQTGMKLFKADIIKPVINMIRIKGFAFDIEVLAIINRLGYKIVDAPVILEYGRSVSWGRINLNTILNVLFDTIKIFYWLNILKYYDVLVN